MTPRAFPRADRVVAEPLGGRRGGAAAGRERADRRAASDLLNGRQLLRRWVLPRPTRPNPAGRESCCRAAAQRVRRGLDPAAGGGCSGSAAGAAGGGPSSSTGGGGGGRRRRPRCWPTPRPAPSRGRLHARRARAIAERRCARAPPVEGGGAESRSQMRRVRSSARGRRRWRLRPRGRRLATTAARNSRSINHRGQRSEEWCGSPVAGPPSAPSPRGRHSSGRDFAVRCSRPAAVSNGALARADKHDQTPFLRFACRAFARFEAANGSHSTRRFFHRPEQPPTSPADLAPSLVCALASTVSCAPRPLFSFVLPRTL